MPSVVRFKIEIIMFEKKIFVIYPTKNAMICGSEAQSFSCRRHQLFYTTYVPTDTKYPPSMWNLIFRTCFVQHRQNIYLSVLRRRFFW